MKRIIRKYLPGIIEFLVRLQKKLARTDLIEDDNAYHSLSPVRNADDVDEYIQALDWAIKRRDENDILNIAITGPYGSGKSSILKTYMETHKDKGLYFMPISLATFKEEGTALAAQGVGNKPVTDEKASDKESILRQIELSILQQIFYFEEDKNIPDSRFKKIRSVSKSELIRNSIRVISLGLAIVGFFFLKPLFDQLNLSASESLSGSIKWVSLIILFFGLCSIVYKSIRTVTSLSISKLKLQNAEIEIGKDISKSALNNHLDEIVYFFEVTRYNVVIIEDLDRFEQTDIFTKLREINQLINRSKKINRRIVFIYAVKDEMFQDKNRTKFFDFIIPIIPVINSSNSSEKLKKIVSNYNYKISETLIDDISLFIDDMRLLYNVMNEYKIYQLKLGEKLDQEKLMGMVIYKNIYPKDFVDLANRSGFLYGVFNKRNDYINAHIGTLNLKIADCNKSLNAVNSLQIKNIQELRMVYILNLCVRLAEFSTFKFSDGTKVSLLQSVNDEYFNIIRADQAYYGSGYNNRPVGVKFSEIEKAVDSEWSYHDRETQIIEWNKNQGNSIKEQIAALEEEKMNARHSKIKDLISASSVDIDMKTPMGQLTAILLRDGYINEDYQDYISIFYPESITREDRQFLLNVKQQSEPNFGHRLVKIHNLLPKLRFTDYKTESILNFDLIDHLLNHEVKQEELTQIFYLLKKESLNAVRFMDAFIDRTENLPKFVSLLVYHWHDVWGFIKVRSKFTDERVHRYASLIIEYCDLPEIKKVAEASDFQSYLENDARFLIIIPDRKKIKNLINLLNLKLSVIDDAEASEDLIDYVYSENYYALNRVMIEILLKRYSKIDEVSLYQRHYHTILRSGCVPLIGYIKEHIEQYIVNAYLHLPAMQDEPESDFWELLNNEAISDEVKARLIGKTSTAIKDIDKIATPALAEALLKADRITPTWYNVIKYYLSKDSRIDIPLTDFLNKEDNAKQLSKMFIEAEQNDHLTEKVKDEFETNLLKLNNLSDSSYIILLKSVESEYDSLDFGHLSEKKVDGLLDAYILALTEENFSLINQHFPNLKPKLLKQRITDLVIKITTFPLAPEDLVPILHDPKIDASSRLKLIEGFDRECLFASAFLKEGIGKFLHSLKLVPPAIDTEILRQVLLTSWNQDQRISLFASRIESFTTEQVDEFLASLKDPYPFMISIGHVVKLENNDTNNLLVKALVKIKYAKLVKTGRKELEVMRQSPAGQ